MSFPRSSNLVTLHAFCGTLCENPALLVGRLFRRDDRLYSVTRIDDRTGIAHLAHDPTRELDLACEHLVLAELLANAGVSTPVVSVNGAPAPRLVTPNAPSRVIGFMGRLSRLKTDQAGNSMVEYVLIASLIALVVAAAFPPVSGAITGVFTSISTALTP